MEAVRGQDDRKRERHAMDGVWLPAGEEHPGARGLPDSRHTPGPGIAKGEAFSPLARRRSPEVNRTRLSARRKRIKSFPPTMRATSSHPSRGTRWASPNSAQPTTNYSAAAGRAEGERGRRNGRADQTQPLMSSHDPLRVIKKQNRLPREPV